MAKSSQKNSPEFIDGRACEPLKLKNGDTVYFIDKIKGKEYRKLRPIVADMFKISVDANSMNADDSNINVGMGAFYESLIKSFPVLALSIRTKEDKNITPTIGYFDDLEEYEDMQAIYNKLEEITSSLKKN